MTAEQAEHIRKLALGTHIQRDDSYSIPVEGPKPEEAIEFAAKTLDRYQAFFDQLPPNLDMLSLLDSSGIGWSVHVTKNDEQKIDSVTLDNWNNKDRTILRVRRYNQDSIYSPVHINDQLGHDYNTSRAMERVTQITTELLSPFETILAARETSQS